MKIWRTEGEKNISKRKQTLKHKSTFNDVLATLGSHIQSSPTCYLQHSGVREGTSTLWRQISFFPNAVIGGKNIMNKRTPHISYTCKKANTMTKCSDLRTACEIRVKFISGVCKKNCTCFWGGALKFCCLCKCTD